MSEQGDNAGLAAFQYEVLKEIKTLHTMVEMNTEFNRAPSKAQTKKQNTTRTVESFGRNISMRLGQMALKNLKKAKSIDEYTVRVREFLKEPETRQMLCSSLRVVDDNLARLAVRDIEHDAAEIASAITPLLFPIARAKTITLPDNPVAFALSAWILARTGIKTYCAGFSETEPVSL